METGTKDPDYWWEVDKKFLREQENKANAPKAAAVPSFGPDDAPF